MPPGERRADAMVDLVEVRMSGGIGMVTAASLLAQGETLFEQLSPLNRLRVIMGLVVVIILGIVIFMVIRAGAHMVRGFSAAAKRLPKTSLPDEDDWAHRPLNSPAKQDD